MSLKIICTFSFVSKSLWITYFSSNTDFLPSYEKWNIRKRYEVLSQNQGRKKWFRSHSTLATIVEMSSLRCNISITMDHHSYSLPSGSCKHPRLKDVLSLQKTEMNLPMAKSLLEIPNGVKLKGMSKVKSDNNQPNYNILRYLLSYFESMLFQLELHHQYFIAKMKKVWPIKVVFLKIIYIFCSLRMKAEPTSTSSNVI